MSFYETMWQSLLDTGFWQGEVWNRRKSGEVYANWITTLAYLRRLPLDQLKIDRSFVWELLEDLNCVAIAQTIIVLGQTMNIGYS